jgi:hypothetical protein
VIRGALLCLLCLTFLPAAIEARASAGGKILLLPVQDRLGDPEAVDAVERALLEALGPRARATEPGRIRDHLRTLRLRDLRLLTQPQLIALSEELAGQHFLVVSLLDLNREPVPSITLSGQLLDADHGEIVWAGFTSSTGRDGAQWLGLGAVDDWRELAHRAVRRLMEDAFAGRAERERPEELEDEPHAFRSPDLPPIAGQRVAVVPFDSIAEGEATWAGTAATDLAYAALDRRGARLVLPGTVNEAMLRSGLLLTGAVRDELRASLPVDLYVTGTAEAWGYVAEGLDPQPEVGLAIRFVDADTGRILAMGSLFRNGWSRPGAFELGHISGAGVLARRMMETLLDRLLSPEDTSVTKRTRTP